MKKTFSIILPIIIMLVVAALCIFAYLIGTNQIKLNIGKQNITNTTNTVAQNNDKVILTQSELPKLDASVLAQPLMTEIIKDFTNNQEITSSMIDYTDTDEAIRNIINGQTDAAITPYPSDDLISLALASGIELEVTPIAKEGFVFIVNKNNPVNTLKVSDIQKIYIGEIKNWSQIGGTDSEIIAFQRPSNSITQREMNMSVMKGLQMVEAPNDVFVDGTYGQINDLIADYNNAENAIGYAYYTEANYLYDFDENLDNPVKMLKVNDVEPTYDNIKDGLYPIITNLYYIRNKNNESEHLQIFTEALLSERGKNVIKEAGYVDE